MSKKVKKSKEKSWLDEHFTIVGLNKSSEKALRKKVEDRLEKEKGESNEG